MVASRTIDYIIEGIEEYTVITRLEISRLRTEIAKIDHDAFIIMNSIKDTKGGITK